MLRSNCQTLPGQETLTAQIFLKYPHFLLEISTPATTSLTGNPQGNTVDTFKQN
jgi:hypothetical protein